MMRFFIGITLVLFFTGVYAQGDLATADKYFKLKSYDKALPLFEDAVSNGVDDPMIHYKLAYCYTEQDATADKLKAIPHFEKALAGAGNYLPADTPMLLGELYHRNGQLNDARAHYANYRKTIKSNQKLINEIDRRLAMIDNAEKLMKQPLDTKIKNLGSIINSPLTEYNPVVATDESVMAYTSLRPNDGKNRSGEKYIEEIKISYNHAGNWSQPEVIDVASDYNVGTAGISPDGQHMLIFIGGAEGTGDLYFLHKTGNGWSDPEPLDSRINSKYRETTGSMTPDGKTIYFASDRPQGLGGLDIYRSDLLPSGEWSAPVNLGPSVNTPYDEDAPFIHPDKWTLFFTSDGHNSMGGRDIFVSRLFNEEWTTPENMGYPINTTFDDNYFTLSADGRKGYFASDRVGGQGGQDLYSIDMPEEESNIPLTMIKGRIFNRETGEPLATTIYMIDVESGKKLDFVYQPDPATGKYLIVLPPSKNYDMVIESEGFLPYTLNINVPGQTYFYELFQQISLEPIRQFDVTVGQRVEVRNAFYDSHEEAVADQKKTHEAKLIHSGDVDVYELMNDLIAAGDEEAIDYLLELINTEHPIEQVNFREDPRLEVAVRYFYYDESDESKFEQKNVGDKTVFSLPSVPVTEVAKRQLNEKDVPATIDPNVLNVTEKIYFLVDKSNLDPKYSASLNDILKLLKEHDELGIQISGYASSEGNEDYNRELSNKRAIAVLEYFNHKGVVRRRIVARGYGETKDDKSSAEESRRVEVKVILLEGHARISAP
ncbi:OmpA family protein [Fulvivirga sedimenti]|uniref:OmpA family protein n=1 Tax=Fulvivirga sedimenti TaxID=2879465 RepID=A0A9X1KY75_9BACT|nr:OmpA family protein [Fulvivirga sedimenti]MCA6073291.1 OmpA family protein [Fulvivirga sedimenti]